MDHSLPITDLVHWFYCLLPSDITYKKYFLFPKSEHLLESPNLKRGSVSRITERCHSPTMVLDFFFFFYSQHGNKQKVFFPLGNLTYQQSLPLPDPPPSLPESFFPLLVPFSPSCFFISCTGLLFPFHISTSLWSNRILWHSLTA